MSLNRFDSVEDILNMAEMFHVTEYSDSELSSVPKYKLLSELKTISDSSLYNEIHIYSLDGAYINSSYDNGVIIDTDNNNIFIDIRQIFHTVGINRGSYQILSNFIYSVFGEPKSNNLDDYFYIDGISSDRQELKLRLNDSKYNIKLQEFREYILKLDFEHIINFLTLNLYENQIYKIVNVRFDQNDSNVFYIKLYKPLQDEILEYRTGWIGLELFDTYVDKVNLYRDVEEIKPIKIKGPNFDIDDRVSTSNETNFKSWNDLLDSNLKTSQSIIDSIFSGSNKAVLNIDYTDFNNFVFYGTATDRVKNFLYKLEVIEKYENILDTLSDNENVETAIVKQNSKSYNSRISTIKESFDNFERWLYYTPTGSNIFTHDISGSVKPYPKYFEGGSIVLNKVQDSISTEWYNDVINIASEFDKGNYNSLLWSVPEFVLMDEGNSEYLLFINMIGQHFDNMYTYIDTLTKIHEKDEHPQRGTSNQLLYHIAKSMGWDVQNSKSLSDLWLYKLGKDRDYNDIFTSGSSDENFKIETHEKQTHILWKRIVNNLPNMLKSKGTVRSIKALMSIYGIPQTLLSIREHGGPGISVENPIKIQDTFGYKLNVDSESYIRVPQDRLEAATFGWGDGSICGISGSVDRYERVPDTYEFRFSTTQSNSETAIPLFIQMGDSDEPIGVISLMSSKLLGGVDFISGSLDYGKVVYEVSGSDNTFVMSEYLPIFDGDMWTIKVSDINQYHNGFTDIKIDIARTKDCLYGRISQRDSIEIGYDKIDTMDVDSVIIAPNSDVVESFNSIISGIVYSGSFEGSIQGYKEYFTIYNDEAFYNHVRNPSAYNTDTISGSYYSLYRYYPLGLDLNRYDHSTVTEISSSHPNQNNQVPTPVEFVNFSGGVSDQYTYFNETFYSTVPRIGDNTINSEKIRIESAKLTSELSPTSKSEMAEFDDAPVDTNKLIIAFSTSDSINSDIINHMGMSSLDKFFGRPIYEFEDNYETLRNKSFEYFKKYQKKQNINKLVRLLSLYDYTFFEQIKQLVPVKADLISGILIEPHILERSKVKISNKPEVSQLNYEGGIDYTNEIEGDIDDLSAEVHYERKINAVTDLIEASIQDHLFFIGDDFNVFGGKLKMYKNVHFGKLYEIIKDNRPDCRYERKVCYFDPYPFKYAENKNPMINSLDNYILSGSNVELVSGSYGISNKIFPSQFKYGILIPEGDGVYHYPQVNIDYESNHFMRFFAIPADPNDDYAILTITDWFFGKERDTQIKIRPGFVNLKKIVKEYRHKMSGLFDYGHPDRSFRITATENDVILFSLSINKLRTEWEESWLRRAYEGIGIKAGCDTEQWYYQIDECSSRNNSRFRGSKLVGAGINIDSSSTVDGGPVVVVKRTNPNQIKKGFGDSEGNLKVG